MEVPITGKTVYFRFYQELNQYLPDKIKKRETEYRFTGEQTVKEGIESFGVPLSLVDMVLLNGNPARFLNYLVDKDKISVFPVFESFDISGLTLPRENALRETKFIVDTGLEGLAEYLSRNGFDLIYRGKYTEKDVIRIAEAGKRIILTRNAGFLRREGINRGILIRSEDPRIQAEQLIRHLHLNAFPFPP